LAIMIFLLVVNLILLLVIFSAFLGFVMTRVPFVPTRASDIEFFAKELGISEKDTFFDLGSGDGKVCFLIEKQTGAKTLGFELTWWTHWLARIKRIFKGSKAKFVNQNFFKHPWSEATVVYGYLYPPLMKRVEKKFLADCRPGSLAVIRDFPFPGIKPQLVFRLPKNHEIYVYRKSG